MVFDHLTAEDFLPNSKPGAAAGFIHALRAVDTTDPRWPNTRTLEAKAKMGGYAQYSSRGGLYRNMSAGFYKPKGQDGKKRFALHHLALLGAIPPAVHGLPELILSEQNSPENLSEILSLEIEGDIPVSPPSVKNVSNQERTVETINLSEHKSLLSLREAELKLDHSAVVTTYKEQVTTLEGKLLKLSEDLEAVVSEKTELEKTLEAEKADKIIAVEAAKQAAEAEGIVKGEAQATEKVERTYREATVRGEVTMFCEGLLKTGRINQKEFKPEGKTPLVDLILSMPAEAAANYRELLEKRPAVTTEPGAEVLAGGASPAEIVLNGSAEAKEANDDKRAKRLVAEGKFKNYREAYNFARSNPAQEA